jgi:NTP pyrophosphatase (non-canonical NTP hydrolase)
MTRAAATLEDLREALRRFAAAREWEQFHTPKNLAMALAVEAAELLEQFQWLTPVESRRLDARKKRAVGEEIADVLLYLTRLADVLGIDPVAAARRKMRINARKYPVRRAKGNARKSSEL